MKAFYILLLFALLLSGCTDDSSVQPPPPPVDPFEDCGNGDPVSPFDSLYHNWPCPKYRISQLRISPSNGWWAGEYYRYGTAEGETSAMGIFVYDPVNDVPIAQYDDAWGHRWSPDGRALILIHGFELYRIDVPSMSLHTPAADYVVNLASWSTDGKRIFFEHYNKNDQSIETGLYSMNPDGSDKHFEGRCGAWAQLLNDSTFIGFTWDSLIFLQRGSLIRTARYIPEMDDFPDHSQLDISFVDETMVFGTVRKGSILDPWGNGLWLLDTESWKPRKIRGAQWWNKLYYPTWAPNGNIYGSVFCRKDSSSMVWEFDLQGNPLRQITKKTMRVWMTQ